MARSPKNPQDSQIDLLDALERLERWLAHEWNPPLTATIGLLNVLQYCDALLIDAARRPNTPDLRDIKDRLVQLRSALLRELL